MGRDVSPDEARRLMRRAIAVMRGSVAEPRADGKTSPRVGAVLRFPDGRVETACRGELRHGEHAEYTLLDRKCVDRKLDGAALFATLEPCAPGSRGHPKLACAERIVAARIKDVWVGIEDPDPTVDRKGIRHLEENGVAIHLFDGDLQQQIRDANKRFLHQALGRAETARKGSSRPQPPPLSAFEAPASNVGMDDLRQSALERYRGRLHSRGGPNSAEFLRALERQGLIAAKGRGHVPTGFGLLLFGDRPRDTYPQAGVICTIRYPDGTEESRDFDGPLVETPGRVEEWLKRRLPNTLDRSTMVRGERQALPFEIVREAVVNALVHRDYEIAGAKIQILVEPEAVTVRSPGGPVAPITLEQLQAFDAPTLSRNPKIHFVFRRMGLAEEAGLGMATMRTSPTKHGFPAPRYSFRDPYLVLVLHRSASSAARALGGAEIEGLSADELRGWAFLAGGTGATTAQYARRMGFDERKAQRHLRRFTSLGLLRRTGAARATRFEVVR